MIKNNFKDVSDLFSNSTVNQVASTSFIPPSHGQSVVQLQSSFSHVSSVAQPILAESRFHPTIENPALEQQNPNIGASSITFNQTASTSLPQFQTVTENTHAEPTKSYSSSHREKAIPGDFDLRKKLEAKRAAASNNYYSSSVQQPNMSASSSFPESSQFYSLYSENSHQSQYKWTKKEYHNVTDVSADGEF